MFYFSGVCRACGFWSHGVALSISCFGTGFRGKALCIYVHFVGVDLGKPRGMDLYITRDYNSEHPEVLHV